jgi:hypothetical protein
MSQLFHSTYHTDSIVICIFVRIVKRDNICEKKRVFYSLITFLMHN